MINLHVGTVVDWRIFQINHYRTRRSVHSLHGYPLDIENALMSMTFVYEWNSGYACCTHTMIKHLKISLLLCHVNFNFVTYTICTLSIFLPMNFFFSLLRREISTPVWWPTRASIYNLSLNICSTRLSSADQTFNFGLLLFLKVKIFFSINKHFILIISSCDAAASFVLFINYFPKVENKVWFLKNRKIEKSWVIVREWLTTRRFDSERFFFCEKKRRVKI